MDNSFASRYLAGELYNGSCYSESWEGELATYMYTASDGTVMVWRHAFDLRPFGLKGAAAIARSFQYVHWFMLYCAPGNSLWALILQSTGPCEDVVTLYHYTDELAFRNVGNLEQSAAQLFASLTDERAHFGKGLYATQHEPAVARLE